MAIPLLLFNMK